MRLVPLTLAILVCACGGKAPDKNTNEKVPAAEAKAEAADPDSPFRPNDVVLDHAVKTLDGQEKKLSDYRGKALVVVNTASQCGYTPQYADLQDLYARYQAKGLEVLAFPSNDFGEQEPGTNEEIRTFVDDEFEVQFEMFDKVHATGPEKSPLFKTLSEETGEGIRGEVKWNFTKFLVDPNGRVVARFEPPVKPTDAEFVTAVERILPQG